MTSYPYPTDRAFYVWKAKGTVNERPMWTATDSGARSVSAGMGYTPTEAIRNLVGGSVFRDTVPHEDFFKITFNPETPATIESSKGWFTHAPLAVLDNRIMEA